MKHFQDDNYDSINDYETNITNHYKDDSDDYDGSLVFRHWKETADDVIRFPRRLTERSASKGHIHPIIVVTSNVDTALSDSTSHEL